MFARCHVHSLAFDYFAGNSSSPPRNLSPYPLQSACHRSDYPSKEENHVFRAAPAKYLLLSVSVFEHRSLRCGTGEHEKHGRRMTRVNSRPTGRGRNGRSSLGLATSSATRSPAANSRAGRGSHAYTGHIAYTNSPIRTCRKNNAADGTGSSIGPPHAYTASRPKPTAEDERGIV